MAVHEVRQDGGGGKAEIPGWPVTHDTWLFDEIMLPLEPLEDLLKHLEKFTEGEAQQAPSASAVGRIGMALLRDFMAKIEKTMNIMEEHTGQPKFRIYRHGVEGYEGKAGQVAAVVFGPTKAQRHAENLQARA